MKWLWRAIYLAAFAFGFGYWLHIDGPSLRPWRDWRAFVRFHALGHHTRGAKCLVCDRR